MFNKVIQYVAPRTQYLDLVFLVQAVPAMAKGFVFVCCQSHSHQHSLWNALRGFLPNWHKRLLVLRFKLCFLFFILALEVSLSDTAGVWPRN